MSNTKKGAAKPAAPSSNEQVPPVQGAGEQKGVTPDSKTPPPPPEKAEKKPKANPAKEIAAKLGVEVLFENDKGEYFTSENLALNSVKGDAKKVAKHQFGKQASE